MPPNFYNDDEPEDEEDITEKKQKVLELEGKLRQAEAQTYNRKYANKAINTQSWNEHKIDEDHIFNERRKQHKDLPLNKKPKDHQVKGILSTKQLVFLGIGLVTLLIFATISLSAKDIGTNLSEWKFPEWKLPVPEEGSTHIKKEDVEWITTWEGKMDWANHKYNDNQEANMARVLDRQMLVDQMNCNELINYIETSPKAALRAYSAHLVLEKGCVIP